MARPFTQQERNRIRDRLMTEGKELFTRYGLQKTNVAELTEAAGIAKGSFYSFFPSKEALYFEIFRREEQQLRERVVETLNPEEPLTRDRFRLFLKQAFRLIEENPFIRRIYLHEDYDRLIRGLPQEYHDEHTTEDIDYLRPLIERWQAGGNMIRKEPGIIISVIRALFVVTLHRDQLGEEYYPATVDLLIDCLATGLIPEGEQTDD